MPRKFNLGYKLKDFSAMLKVNRQRQTSLMQSPELKIPTLAKWLISPLMCKVIKICKKPFVLKTNSNINICSET